MVDIYVMSRYSAFREMVEDSKVYLGFLEEPVDWERIGSILDVHAPGSRVMVVDDEPAMQTLFRSFIKRRGHEPVISSRRDALDNYTSDTNLIFFYMNEKNDLAIAEELKKYRF